MTSRYLKKFIPLCTSATQLAFILLATHLFNYSFAATECLQSKWGKNDTLGSANLISTKNILKAAALIKKGKSHPLGVVIDSSTPTLSPRSLNFQVVSPGQTGGNRLDVLGYPGVSNDDLMQTWIGIGSQIDGLGHLGEAGMYYNCLKDSEITQVTGLTKLGLHAVPPLVGRAVLLDMSGPNGTLEAGEYFGKKEIKASAAAAGVKIEKGDIVLMHTGWTDAMLKDDPEGWIAAEPGLSVEGARYLASLDVLAVGTDSWGLDPVPPAPGDGLYYSHVVLLQEHGIYILETMDVGPLVKEGVVEFMFVLGQPRIRGSVQMMINPVALY